MMEKMDEDEEEGKRREERRGKRSPGYSGSGGLRVTQCNFVLYFDNTGIHTFCQIAGF